MVEGSNSQSIRPDVPPKHSLHGIPSRPDRLGFSGKKARHQKGSTLFLIFSHSKSGSRQQRFVKIMSEREKKSVGLLSVPSHPFFLNFSFIPNTCFASQTATLYLMDSVSTAQIILTNRPLCNWL